MQPQVQIPVVAQITITLNAQGRLGCSFDVPNRPTFNMMMETGKQDMLRSLAEKEQGNGLQIAPPGLEVERNKKA